MNRFVNRPAARWGALILACLLAAACQEKRDPVKPTVGRAGPAPSTTLS